MDDALVVLDSFRRDVKEQPEAWRHVRSYDMCTPEVDQVFVTDNAVIGRLNGVDIIVISTHYSKPRITSIENVSTSDFDKACRMVGVYQRAMVKAINICKKRDG